MHFWWSFIQTQRNWQLLSKLNLNFLTKNTCYTQFTISRPACTCIQMYIHALHPHVFQLNVKWRHSPSIVQILICFAGVFLRAYLPKFYSEQALRHEDSKDLLIDFLFVEYEERSKLQGKETIQLWLQNFLKEPVVLNWNVWGGSWFQNWSVRTKKLCERRPLLCMSLILTWERYHYTQSCIYQTNICICTGTEGGQVS